MNTRGSYQESARMSKHETRRVVNRNQCERVRVALPVAKKVFSHTLRIGNARARPIPHAGEMRRYPGDSSRMPASAIVRAPDQRETGKR
jgi:hypothetical protein